MAALAVFAAHSLGLQKMGMEVIESPARIRPKISKSLLFILAGVFLISRILILLTNVEWVSNLEELYRGALAREWIDGLKFPIWDYQADSYSGGSLVMGFFTSFFFRVLGPSLFALKLTALLIFSWPSWILSVYFMGRFFGRCEAFLTACIYLLAPPTLIANSLFGMGFHSDSILFSVLIFIGCYEYQFKEKKVRWLFFAGFFGGLGTWFINTVFLTLAACVLALGFQKKNFWPLRAWGILAFGFLMGGLPWIAYNLTHHPGGFEFLKGLYLDAAVVGEPSFFRLFLTSAKRILLLITYWFPLSFGYLKILGIPGMMLGYIHYILFGYLLIEALENKKISPAIKPFFVYFGLFFASYVFAFGISLPHHQAYSEFRYFAPLFWVLLLCSAALVPLHPKAKILSVLFLILGILGYGSLVRTGEWGKSLLCKGYSYFRFTDPRTDLWNQIPKLEGERRRFFEKYPNPDRQFFLWGLNQQYPFQEENLAFEAVEVKLKTLSRPERITWLAGLGFYLGQDKKMDFFLETLKGLSAEDKNALAYGYSMALPNMQDSFPDYLENGQKVPQAVQLYFFFALGQMVYDPEEPVWFFPSRKLLQVPELYRSWVYRGIGAAFSGYWIWDPAHFNEKFNQHLVRIPAEYREDFYWGTGWGIRREINEDKQRAHDWLSRLPEAARLRANEGMNFFEEFFGISE